MKCEKFGCHFFSCQSLLLGTNVPNDNIYIILFYKITDILFYLQIKIYAVKRYNNEGLELASKYFFEAQSINSEEEGNSNYDTIFLIIILTSFLPAGLMPLALFLAPILVSHLEERFDKHFTSHFNEYFIVSLKAMTIISSIFLNILFFACHMAAIVMLFEYIHEITDENDLDNSRSTDVTPPVIHTLISVMSLIIIIPFTIIKIRSWRVPLVLNFVYMAYFFPYMFLSFIDNPMQTVFIYALLVIAAAFILLLLFSFTSARYILNAEKRSQYYRSYAISCSSLYLIYFFVCVLLLLNLGGYNSFAELRTLFWPITGGILVAVGLYYFKEVRKKLSK